MEISPCHNSIAGHQIATNFCTCHDSTAVVPCAKFCSDHCIRIEMRANRNSHRIWIAMEKPLVKRAPETCSLWLWLITTYAFASRWQIEMVRSPKMLKLFKVNVIILLQPKPLWQYQWSNMSTTKLSVAPFWWFKKNRDDITIVAQHVRDLFTIAAKRPSQRIDWNASAVWNREFSNTNLNIFFPRCIAYQTGTYEMTHKRTQS